MLDVSLEKSFTFEGKDYEIYRIQDDDMTIVQAFINGQFASGHSCSIHMGARLKFKAQMGYDPLSDLIAFVEEDIRSKTWEKYLDAVKRLRADRAK